MPSARDEPSQPAILKNALESFLIRYQFTTETHGASYIYRLFVQLSKQIENVFSIKVKHI
jgi:hypothetical protein